MTKGQGHTSAVGGMAFSNLSTSFLVTGSHDMTLKLWHLTFDEAEGYTKDMKMAVKATEKAHDKDINSVAVSPNDKLIASGSQDKTVKVNILMLKYNL